MEFQNVPIVFTEGVDTKTDKYLRTQNDVLKNATVSGKGTPSKRNGYNEIENNIFYQGLATGEAASSINEIFTGRKRAGISTDKGYVHLNPVADRLELPETQNCQLSQVFIDFKADTSQVSGSVLCAGAATASNSTMKAYFANQVLYILSKDGAMIAERATTGIAKLCSVDNRIFFANQVPSVADSIFISEILSNGDTAPIGQLDDVDFTALNTTKFDLSHDGNKTLYLCAFKGSANRIMVKSFHIDTLATQYAEPLFVTGTSKNQVPAVAVDFVANRAVATYIADDSGTFKVYAEIFNLGLTPVLGSQEIDTLAVGAISATAVCTSVSEDGVLLNVCTYNGRTRFSQYDVISNVFIQGLTRMVLLATSKPIKRSRYYYIAMKQLVVDNVDPFIVDHYLIGLDSENGFGLNVSVSTVLAQGIQDAGLTANYLLPSYLDGYGASSLQFGQFYALSFDRTGYGSSLEVSSVGYITGGFSYDGSVLKPIGFYKRPVLVSADTATAGLVPNGSYNYQVVLARVNGEGEIERSAPSEALNVTVGSGPKQVALTINTQFVGYPFKIEVYRKLNTETVYRLAAESAFGSELTLGTVIDNRASLSGQPALYTTRGVLENDPPPALSCLTFHQGRVFGVNALKTSEIWFSKIKEVGIGVQFSEFNTIQLEENQGRVTERVTGVASLDNKLIVFKEKSVFVIFGAGPDNAGLGGEFSRPELVSSEVGCIDPRSICNTSEGVYFKSKKGLYVLTRGLEVVEIGAPVAGFNDQRITSATVMAEKQQVRFGTKESQMLVYDYYYKQWSTFDNVQSVAAVQIDNDYYVAQAGQALIENDAFNDDGDFIQQNLTTGWLKMSGINGFQRVQRLKILGEYKSAHVLKVRVSYDYEEYTWDEYTLPPSGSHNITTKPTIGDYQNAINNGVFEWDIHLKRQKCESIKVQIFDVEDAVQGASFDLTGMTLKVGIKRGLSKTADPKRK
jgi:hypothetical protein